jgi:hypothetical protein
MSLRLWEMYNPLGISHCGSAHEVDVRTNWLVRHRTKRNGQRTTLITHSLSSDPYVVYFYGADDWSRYDWLSIGWQSYDSAAKSTSSAQ